MNASSADVCEPSLAFQYIFLTHLELKGTSARVSARTDRPLRACNLFMYPVN